MALLVVPIASGCAAGRSGNEVAVRATLDGQPAAASSPSAPIALRHEETIDLAVEVSNATNDPVEIGHVRIEGEMLGLIFLTYDTALRATVPPGERRTISFPLDLFDLDGQAHGLLRARLRLFDPERRPLGATDLVVDGRGSPLATTAVFTIVLAVMALGSFVWNLVSAAWRSLPPSRVARGLRFGCTGVSSGLAISAGFSTLRIWPLSTTSAALVTVTATSCGLLVGYISPGWLDPRRHFRASNWAVADLNAGQLPNDQLPEDQHLDLHLGQDDHLGRDDYLGRDDELVATHHLDPAEKIEWAPAITAEHAAVPPPPPVPRSQWGW